MLFRLAAPLTGFLKTRPSGPAPRKSVPELLAALAEVRARKAELEREEKELVDATRARLLEEQEALKSLERKVQDCGIAVTGDEPSPLVPSRSAVESSASMSTLAAD